MDFNQAFALMIRLEAQLSDDASEKDDADGCGGLCGETDRAESDRGDQEGMVLRGESGSMGC